MFYYQPMSDFWNLCSFCFYLDFKTDGAVSIGDVSIKLKTPSSPELVPVKYGE